MEGYDRFSEEEIKLLARLLLEQGVPVEQARVYVQEILARRSCEPTLQERNKLYRSMLRKVDIFAGIAAVLLAMLMPFGKIPFAAFAIALFTGRISDILSTVFCLRLPWMFETNPHYDAHRLGAQEIFGHLFRVLFNLVPAYLISLWFPLPVKIILLTYTIGSFVATASNLYQAFTPSRTNTAVLAISNGAIGTGIYFLLKSLLS